MATTEKPNQCKTSTEMFDTSSDSERSIPRDATNEEIQNLPHIRGNVCRNMDPSNRVRLDKLRPIRNNGAFSWVSHTSFLIR